MVGFSGDIMANSLEVKELTTLKNEYKIVLVQEKATPC
jgi:hypothetical protein